MVTSHDLHYFAVPLGDGGVSVPGDNSTELRSVGPDSHHIRFLVAISIQIKPAMLLKQLERGVQIVN